jgi:hypothetical protein
VPKQGAAEPPPLNEKPASDQATPRERLGTRRAHAGWLPSEAVLGIVLLVFGITVAVLILTGAVKLGFAP